MTDKKPAILIRVTAEEKAEIEAAAAAALLPVATYVRQSLLLLARGRAPLPMERSLHPAPAAGSPAASPHPVCTTCHAPLHRAQRPDGGFDYYCSPCRSGGPL